MGEITYYDIKSLYRQHGYHFAEEAFNVNPFGIRNRGGRVDEFNDVIGIAFTDDFESVRCLAFRGTTDPGLYYLKNKLGNINGTFILQPGFHPNCWTKGKHSGKYDAIVQAGTNVFRGWRDKDADGELDMTGPIYTDVTGLNLHTTSFLNEIEKVGAYSAGCQVVKDFRDFEALRHICYKSMDLWGRKLSYALFER